MLEWISWKDMEKITISGPHRKWIEEIKKSSDTNQT
jgi:hypothetical protein